MKVETKFNFGDKVKFIKLIDTRPPIMQLGVDYPPEERVIVGEIVGIKLKLLPKEYSKNFIYNDKKHIYEPIKTKVELYDIKDSHTTYENININKIEKLEED